MKYAGTNKPPVCMLTNSKCYKNTYEMPIKGVLWHSTGAANPNLKRYVQPSDDAANREAWLKHLGKNNNKNDWNHVQLDVGMNAFIGKLADGSVTAVQTMPWTYRPWGCASGRNGSCNSGWIQFEICEDNLNNKDYFIAVYTEACELTAYLCKMYNLDPFGTVDIYGVKVPVILCHADSYKLGMGSNHSDVYHWFNKYGKTMDDVRADVAKLLNITGNTTTPVVIAPATDTNSAFIVKVTADALDIMPEAVTKYDPVGCIEDKGSYTIVEVSGDWGKLKSGAGWINLKHTKKLKTIS